MRHRIVISKLVPYFADFVVINIALSILASPVVSVLVAFAAMAVGYVLSLSKVHVAVMPGLIKAAFYSQNEIEPQADAPPMVPA